MTVTKFRFTAISVLVMAGAATLWLMHRQSEISEIKLREKIESLQTELDQLRQQRTENERPSTLLAQAGSALADNQSLELLKLRGEVGALRQQTNELLKLQAENRQLRSDQASGKPQRQLNLAAGDAVPVESLTFAGYATPEAAFQSTLSAHAKGDFKTLFEGFTPELRQKEEKGITEKSEGEIATWAAEQAAHFAASSVRILNSRSVSDDEAELTVFITAEKNLVTLSMKRIAGEWKISKEEH